MREHVIEQLRKCSYIVGKERTWVSQLSDDQLFELFLRLRRGQTAKSIARHIQQAWGLNPESSVHSLSQGVLKFKKRIAHLLLSPPADSASRTDPPDIEEIGQLEELESLERIHEQQMERILRLMAEEKETSVKHTGMSREIQAITSLTKALTKAREWAMLSKGNDPLRTRRLKQMQRKLAARFPDIMNFTDGGDRLLKATQKFLELAEEHAVEFEVEDHL